MPIYEYQCRDCGRRSEEFQKMSDPPLTECGECGGELKKLISAPAVQFKGSGWYVTDYADSGGKKKKGETSGDSSASSSGADGGDSGSTKTSKNSGGSKDSGSSSSSGSASPAGTSGSSSSPD